MVGSFLMSKEHLWVLLVCSAPINRGNDPTISTSVLSHSFLAINHTVLVGQLSSSTEGNLITSPERMKQKVVISVQMEDAKRRSKAMKIVVGVTGVLSAAIEGADKNQIVVVGEDVDSATLATSLKKKMGSALLVSVLPVQDKKEEKKEEKKQEKQKVVIKLQMDDAKRRSKAMKIVVGVTGVLSAAIEGADKNQIVVVGEDVDPVKLTTSLKKKMGFAKLVSVLPVQDKKEEEKKQEKKPEKKQEKKEEKEKKPEKKQEKKPEKKQEKEKKPEKKQEKKPDSAEQPVAPWPYGWGWLPPKYF